MTSSDISVDGLIEQLKDNFTELLPPATDSDFQYLLTCLENDCEEVFVAGIPEELESLWRASSEWHLIENHYNVFGFNLFSPRQIVNVTKDVFGSQEIRQQWAADAAETRQQQENCGSPGWMCIASYSEYDYIFMNFNKASPMFGATRHMVNNTNEDETLTDPPFSNFIRRVLTHIDTYIESDE